MTTQILNLGPGLQPDLVAALTSSYTASAPFPQQFAEANRFAHRWMFTDAVGSQTDAEGRWVVDIGPMLNDTSIKDTLQNYNIEVPQSLPVPLTQNAPEALRRAVTNSGYLGSVVHHRCGGARGGVCAVDLGGCPFTRQSACGAGGLGADRRCCRVGRAGDRPGTAGHRSGRHLR